MSANSFNLARRMSVRNEPDMLRKLSSSDGSAVQRSDGNSHYGHCLTPSPAEEDMMENTQTTPPSTPMSRRACFQMLESVCHDAPLPKECEQYPEVVLQRKNSDPANHAIAFQGMSHAEASRAKAARERGMLNHAQIQRRMTTGSSKRIW